MKVFSAIKTLWKSAPVTVWLATFWFVGIIASLLITLLISFPPFRILAFIGVMFIITIAAGARINHFMERNE
jgi:hypothetical protein